MLRLVLLTTLLYGGMRTKRLSRTTKELTWVTFVLILVVSLETWTVTKKDSQSSFITQFYGATGRNFAVWLDNSKGQVPYKPEFMIGHGGRFRTFWCMPDELSGENMHPAPMPLNKHGRPFAPITSLRQYTQPDESMQAVVPKGEFSNNHD